MEDAANAPNLEEIEQQFAVKAVGHAQTYWALLESQRGSGLRLTKDDDAIYASLNATFPDLDVRAIDEEAMKSREGKARWRAWMLPWEGKVDDFNFGTLLRTRADGEYDQANTIFCPRMQFYAIEIKRNRLALNDWIVK